MNRQLQGLLGGAVNGRKYTFTMANSNLTSIMDFRLADTEMIADGCAYGNADIHNVTLDEENNSGMEFSKAYNMDIVLNVDNSGNGDYKEGRGHCICFTRSFRGVTGIVDNYAQAYKASWGNDIAINDIYGKEMILCYITDDGIIRITYQDPMLQSEILTDNAELLDFPQIEQLANDAIMTKYADYGGKETKYRIHVESIELAYVCEKGEDGAYTLIPAWVFLGKDEYDMPNEIIALNAIDGTEIKRDFDAMLINPYLN